MSNVIWGVPIVSICALAYAYTWRLVNRERYGLALSIIVVCGLVLRIYVGADHYLHDWDERYHALVSRNLLRHWLVPTLYEHPVLPYSYRNWTANHIWLHKQPLTLWLMALSVRAFGLHAFAVRIPAILFSTIAIKLVYDIARVWYEKRIAIIAAFLFSIHGQIIELASGRVGTDSVDVLFLFFILLAVWLSIRAIRSKKLLDHLLVGIAIGLATLTKWLPALIVLPIWAVLAFAAFKEQRGKMFGCFVCLLLAAIAVALPWQLYILHRFPIEARWEYAYNSGHLNSALEGHEGNIFYYFDHLRMKYGELVYLPVLWFTWRGVKSKRAQDYAVLLWFWTTYLFFSFAATKMEAYTIIAAPAVFMITAVAFVTLEQEIKANKKYRYLLAMACVALIALPIRYSIERIKPFTTLDRNPDWNKAIKVLQRSTANSAKTVLYNCNHPIEAMFYTECTAYEQPLDSTIKQTLEATGYSVLEAHF